LFGFILDSLLLFDFCIALFVITCRLCVPKLLDLVKAFERYEQKCELDPFLAQAVYRMKYDENFTTCEKLYSLYGIYFSQRIQE